MKVERKFGCSCCGECCRHIENLLPDYDKGNGVCKFLDEETNLCTIYDSRPFICRVDDIYDELYRDKMSRSDFYRWTHEACDKLRYKSFSKKTTYTGRGNRGKVYIDCNQNGTITPEGKKIVEELVKEYRELNIKGSLEDYIEEQIGNENEELTQCIKYAIRYNKSLN